MNDENLNGIESEGYTDRFETGDWVRVDGKIGQVIKYRAPGMIQPIYAVKELGLLDVEENTTHWEKVDMSNAYDVLSIGPI